ncbi:hypothetical protein IFVP203_C1220600 [Vibrio parahaemolyticus]
MTESIKHPLCNKCNLIEDLLSEMRSLPLVFIKLTDSVNVIFLVKLYWGFNYGNYRLL